MLRPKIQIVYLVCLSLMFLFSSIYSLDARSEETTFSELLHPAQEKLTYHLGPEDTLKISVWPHPELTETVIVRPDGKISFPLVDEIIASGLTPAQLDKEITAKLSKFIENPQVTIIVSGFKSKKICVLGEVSYPGVYPLSGRVTALEAIVQAGSYKNTAVPESTMIISKGFTEEPQIRRVDLKRVIVKGDVSEDILLQPGDIVYMPKSFITKVNTFVDQFFNKIRPSLTTYLTGYDVVHPARRP